MAGEQARQVLRRLALSLSTPLPRSRSRMSVLATPFYLHQLKTVPSVCAARPPSFSRRERGTLGLAVVHLIQPIRAEPVHLPPGELLAGREHRNADSVPPQCLLIPLGGDSWLYALLSVSFMPPLLVSQSDPDAGQNGDLLDVLDGEKMVHEEWGGRAADQPCLRA
jgi:hypothetical protein